MATLALTSIGTALGGPLGGALGGLIGQSIDHQLFGPGMRKGPRIGDLSVQTSSYGSPIPRIYGAMRVAGTVVWATDLQEEEAIDGGGKGGPGQLGYRYCANLAVALSSRPINMVRRIWADGKLIRGAAGDFKVRTKFRVQSGSEDQPVDPLMASVETIEKTPAYRGLALAIFEGLELAEFGNRIPLLTFEVEADQAEITLSKILKDASDGAILADDGRSIPGFAAHGSSIGDSLRDLINIMGVELAERDGALRTPSTSLPVLVEARELGSDADGETRAKIERAKAPDSLLPATLSLTYYDPDRDYQTGQMRASCGRGGARHDRIELPAALSAGQARQLAEQALSRRWRAGDRLRISLPPRRMELSPGDAIHLAESTSAWVVQSVSVEGMAVFVEAEASPVAAPALDADPGRPVSEPDLPIGRTDLILFELPAMADGSGASIQVYLAAANAGQWKPVPMALELASDPIAGMAAMRRAMIGRAETLLDPRVPMILDELSTVDVKLFNPDRAPLNADLGALMAGANLALIGDELIQFGRAEQLGTDLFRLSRLLRGRRGTEWAAATHAIGEHFCLIDPASVGPIEIPASATGAMLTATARGLNDVAPLPTATRLISGESLRPPSPCHLKVLREGTLAHVYWTRRSHCGWIWADGVGDADDPFAELYRLTITGPVGQVTIEADATSVSLNISELPALPGQEIKLSAVTVGPMAVSREAVTTFLI